jgi:peptidyl-prolyl cis-trans isomerase B (cyclophilin B)
MSTDERLPTDTSPESARRQRRTKLIALVAIVAILGVLVVTVIAAASSGPTKPVDDYAQFDSGTGEDVPPVPPRVHPSYAAATPPQLDIPTQLAAPLTRPKPFPATVSCAYPPSGDAAKEVTPPPAAGISARGTVPVTLSTTIGEIELKLDRALAPCTVNNFVSLAQQSYFNDTTCHRLTTTTSLQVLQCGDPTGTGTGGPGYKFADETYPELTYGPGQIAMANAGPNTNGSQFFMIYGSASGLSPDYTVFGTISAISLPRLDNVAKAGVAAGEEPSDGTPATKVTITGARVG